MQGTIFYLFLLTLPLFEGECKGKFRISVASKITGLSEMKRLPSEPQMTLSLGRS